MADHGWKRRFDKPIVLPGGGKLFTLKHAIAWLAKEIPQSEHGMKEVQTAARCVTEAAENDGPMQFARIGMMKAINRLGTKAADDSYRPGFLRGFLAKMLKDFTWRNIALFVIALIVATYLMLLAVLIAVDRLYVINLGSGG